MAFCEMRTNSEIQLMCCGCDYVKSPFHTQKLDYVKLHMPFSAVCHIIQISIPLNLDKSKHPHAMCLTLQTITDSACYYTPVMCNDVKSWGNKPEDNQSYTFVLNREQTCVR